VRSSLAPSATGFGPDDATHAAFERLTAAQPWLVDVGEVVAVALHPWVGRTAVAAGCVLAWRAGHHRRAGVVAITMLVGSAVGVALKVLVRRQRPPFSDPIAAEIGWSMPSGHALNGALAIGLLLVLAWPWLRGRGPRSAAVAAGAVVVAAVCVDRLVLGVHYLSDVVVGAALGAVATAAAARTVAVRTRGSS